MNNLKNLLIILFFIFFENFLFSQEKVPSLSQIDSLLRKGNMFFKEADFENSLKLLRKTFYYSKLVNNDSISALACNRIARNFSELSEFKKAIIYFEKGLIYAEKAKRDNIKEMILINLGNIYANKDYYDLKKAIDFYFKALKLAKKIKDFDGAFTINLNLAWTYFGNNMFETGYKYLDYTNINFEKYGDNNFFTSINMLNGMYYSHKNQNVKAKYYFEKGISLNTTVTLKQEKQFLYLEYSKFLAKTGDFKNAYINQQKGQEISDKLFHKSKILKASIIGVNLEIDNYKSELQKLEAENNLQNKNYHKSRVINILTVLLTLILVLLLYVLSKSSKFNKATNEVLIKKNHQLKIAIEKAQDANKLKSQFVSTISHELRTPLYGVIGITDIIYDEHKQLIDNKHLEALKFSANYLLSLINDILHISKIEESKIVLDNNNFDIFTEVHAIINALKFIANKNNVVIDSKIDANIPKLIVGDQTRLAQILMNLLTNALKFTKNGKVLVELNLENVVGKTHYINFKIQDSGIGIALENQSKVFDKFTQIKNVDDDYQGTGLGLSIVKKLIDLFKSEIFLESEVGSGSTFSFTIGFDAAEKEIISISENLEENLEIKILVVEDNKINQLVTKKIIQQQKQACKIVSSGLEAIEVLKVESYDVILMDINMPELNGFETTIEIRKMAIYVPIIALTAYNKKQVLQQAKLSGIDAVLVKPFEPTRLFEVIRKLLKEKNAD